MYIKKKPFVEDKIAGYLHKRCLLFYLPFLLLFTKGGEGPFVYNYVIISYFSFVPF